MMDPWIAVAVGILVLTVFLLGLLVPRKQRTVRAPVTDAKLDAINTRLSFIESNQVALDARQIKTDHDVKNIRMSLGAMPTKDSLNQVRMEVAGLTGKVDGMHGTLQTNGHSLRRIEDFLINAAVTNIAGKGTEASK